jgi:ribosomal protein S27AE
MADPRRRSLQRVEVSAVAAPDGQPSVLLHLEHGYLVMNPEDAVDLARVLVEVADTVRAGFTCPVCGGTSHHPKDVEQGYCGRCHAWTGEKRS